MSLLNNYTNDLLKSRTTPLLIELSKKDLDSFCLDDICGLDIALAMASEVYDSDAKVIKKNETNVIFIDANKVTNLDGTYLFEQLLIIINVPLITIKDLNIAKKGISTVLSSLTGGISKTFFGDFVDNGLDLIFGTIVDDINDILVEEGISEIDLSTKLLDKIQGRVIESVNNKTIQIIQEIKNDNIYLSATSKEVLEELSKKFTEKSTPAEYIRLAIKIMLSIAIDMPTAIFIKNPHKLDKDSLAILSLLLSYSKNKKEDNYHTNLLIIYAYDDEEFQPYNVKEGAYAESRKLLSEQRIFTQRYAMLERPTSDIPKIAVKSHMFVGREDERESLLQRYKYSEANKNIATLEIISGEPGIGKTKLVKKHLEDLLDSTPKQIQLTLLNQVGHASSNTGISSLINSILEETSRLEELRTFREVTTENAKSYIPNAIFNALKNYLEIDSAIDVYNLAEDRLTVDGKIEHMKIMTQEDTDFNKSKDKRLQQYLKLNAAITELQEKLSDKDIPIVLFIDDLQWIDDESAEYVLTQFVNGINKFNVHIVASIRPSDSATSLKKLYTSKEQHLYTIALLKKAGIKIYEEDESDKKREIDVESDVDIDKLNFIQRAELKGLDFRTLNTLLSQVIKGEQENRDILSSMIIEKLGDRSRWGTVNTLFAVETINMLCDEKLYAENEDPKYTIKDRLIISNPNIRFNPNIITKFKEALEKTFKILDEKYQEAFKHINEDDNQSEFIQKFNLMAYAVLEERLCILKMYFTDYGNAAVNTLLFSSLLGTPFNSRIVENILKAIANTDKKLLQPLKNYILESKEEVILTEAHYEIIEEVYEILSKYITLDKAYEYRHSLLNIFLDKQLSYQLDKVIDKDNIEARDKLYTLILNEIKKETEKQYFYNQHENSLSQNEYLSIIFFTKINLKVLHKAIKNNESEWSTAFVNASLNLALLYKNINEINISVNILEELLEFLQKLYQNNLNKWAKDYTDTLNNLSYLYYYEGNISEVIQLKEKVLQIRKDQYSNDNINWAKEYVSSLIGLASTHKDIGNIDEAIRFVNDAIDISKKEYFKNKKEWADNYVRSLLKQAITYRERNQIDKSIELCKKSLKISQEHYALNPHEYIEIYVRSLNNLSRSYLNKKDLKKAISYSSKSLELLKILYAQNPDRWVKEFIINANSLSKAYKKDNQLSKCIEIEDDILEITSNLYNNVNSSIWVKYFILGLSNRASSYVINNDDVKAFNLYMNCLPIVTSQYTKNKAKYKKLYMLCIESLISIHKRRNEVEDVEILKERLKTIV